LGDFGVEKLLDNTADLARTISGTPDYLEPDFWNSKPDGPADDIWSFGPIFDEYAR
jgi:NIMA (never in mitosis gene a)-related kinase